MGAAGFAFGKDPGIKSGHDRGEVARPYSPVNSISPSGRR